MLQILPIQVTLEISFELYHRDLTPRFSFQKSDEGWFECQISSTPIISHLVYLDIAGEQSAAPTLAKY